MPWTLILIAWVLFMLAVLTGVVHAAGPPEKWAQIDPVMREWFRGLHNDHGTSCCDSADGVRIEDPDWRQLDDEGNYEVFARDRWNRITPEYVLKATNRVGYAILWWPAYMDHPTCFLPGARG